MVHSPFSKEPLQAGEQPFQPVKFFLFVILLAILAAGWWVKQSHAEPRQPAVIHLPAVNVLIELNFVDSSGVMLQEEEVSRLEDWYLKELARHNAKKIDPQLVTTSLYAQHTHIKAVTFSNGAITLQWVKNFNREKCPTQDSQFSSKDVVIKEIRNFIACFKRNRDIDI